MGSSLPGYDVGVDSVGAGDSMAFVEGASVGSVGLEAVAEATSSVAGAAETVTEAGGAVVEMGRRGATP